MLAQVLQSIRVVYPDSYESFCLGFVYTYIILSSRIALLIDTCGAHHVSIIYQYMIFVLSPNIANEIESIPNADVHEFMP